MPGLEEFLEDALRNEEERFGHVSELFSRPDTSPPQPGLENLRRKAPTREEFSREFQRLRQPKLEEISNQQRSAQELVRRLQNGEKLNHILADDAKRRGIDFGAFSAGTGRAATFDPFDTGEPLTVTEDVTPIQQIGGRTLFRKTNNLVVGSKTIPILQRQEVSQGIQGGGTKGFGSIAEGLGQFSKGLLGGSVGLFFGGPSGAFHGFRQGVRGEMGTSPGSFLEAALLKSKPRAGIGGGEMGLLDTLLNLGIGTASGGPQGGLQSLLPGLIPGRQGTSGTGFVGGVSPESSYLLRLLLQGQQAPTSPFLGGVGGEVGGLPGTGGTSQTPTPNILEQILGQFGKLNLPGLPDTQGLGRLPGIFDKLGRLPAPSIGTGGILNQIGRLGGIVGGIPGAILGKGGLISRGRELLGGEVGQNVATLGGLGLLGAGLATDVPAPELEAALAGLDAESRGQITEQLERERLLRQAREQQFIGQREQARTRLEDILGRETQENLTRAIQTRQEQLNRQGLLGGPSGALNEALAQEAGRVRRAQLPAILQFEQETQSGLEGLRGAGLEGEIGLQRTGLERGFGISGQQRQARLLDKLLSSQRAQKKREELLRLGSAGVGLGLGGLEGAQSAGSIFGGGQQRRSRGGMLEEALF